MGFQALFLDFKMESSRLILVFSSISSNSHPSCFIYVGEMLKDTFVCHNSHWVLVGMVQTLVLCSTFWTNKCTCYVVHDCRPFLGLAFVILAGFSVALFVLFQCCSIPPSTNATEEEDDDDDEGDLIHESFGSQWRSLSTLFYAMVGTFEVEVRLWGLKECVHDPYRCITIINLCLGWQHSYLYSTWHWRWLWC